MLLQEPVGSGDLLANLFPILCFIAIMLLLLVAWMVWMQFRRSGRKENEQAEGGKAGEPDLLGRLFGGATTSSSASTPAAEAAMPPSRQPSQAAYGDAVEVFRVLRDLADGSLIVEIDGQAYHRLSDIADAQVGRRFVANARALAHFALLIKGPPPPAPPPQAPAPTLVETPPPAAPSPQPPRPRVSTTAGPVEPVPMRPIKALRQQRDKEEGEEPPAQMISVADEIEALLQHRLASDPGFVGRSLHVRPGPGGGVRIEVDGRPYEAVGEVPDPEVRDFIQETIRMWNEQN